MRDTETTNTSSNIFSLKKIYVNFSASSLASPVVVIASSAPVAPIAPAVPVAPIAQSARVTSWETRKALPPKPRLEILRANSGIGSFR